MEKLRITPTLSSLLSILAALVVVVWELCPPAVHAEVVPIAIPAQSPVLITEILPGTSMSASQEFIKLFNASDQTIDFDAGDWRLEAASTTATSWDPPFRSLPLTGAIAPGAYYLVASQYTTKGTLFRYLSTTAQIWMTAGITATGGHVRLVHDMYQTQPDGSCVRSTTTVDEVEWTTRQDEQLLVPSLDERMVFPVSRSSGIPTTQSLGRVIDESGYYRDTDNDALDFSVGEPTPEVLISNLPLRSSLDVPFDSCDSDPSDDVEIPPSSTPTEPETSDANEQPTEQPPPDAGSDEPTQDGEPTASAVATEVRLSEILPNPAPPFTDEADEFIELYNAGGIDADVSGYRLQAGLTAKRTYVLPAGTRIAPHGFLVLTAAVTKLVLANSGSQVILLGPDGTVVAQTTFGAAKDGMAWADTEGAWHWTNTPTPGKPNVLTAVAPNVKNAAAKQPSKSKTTAKKVSTTTKKTTAKTTKPKKEQTANAATLVSDEQSGGTSGLSVTVLAVAALFAVLYGAYEYRGDLANKLHKLRANRAARRAARKVAEGR